MSLLDKHSLIDMQSPNDVTVAGWTDWYPQLISTTSAADSLAIPVTHALVIKTTGADAEALTLADGEPGQLLEIVLGTDGGGDGTLTPSTATGWATIVFADAGDRALLHFKNSTVGWTIRGLSGVAGPPVTTV